MYKGLFVRYSLLQISIVSKNAPEFNIAYNEKYILPSRIVSEV